MAKIRRYTSDHDSEETLCFFCPGCHCDHPFRIKSPTRPNWEWNGSFDAPTFTPSLLCNASFPESSCHSVVTDGNKAFLEDCHHELRGKTVQLPEIEE